jgi:hypothetical protein
LTINGINLDVRQGKCMVDHEDAIPKQTENVPSGLSLS